MHPARASLWTSLAVFVAPALTFAQTAPAPAQAPYAAPAPATGGDVLRLRDGAILRGTIVERRADGTTVIMLATGEARTVPGAEIASVAAVPSAGAAPPTYVPPSYVAPAAPPSASPDDTSIASLTPAPGRVPLVVRSVEGRTNVGMSLGTTVHSIGLGFSTLIVHHYGQLCTTPCTIFVRPGNFPFWSGGDGLMKVERDIFVPPGGLDVRVHASSAGAHSGGVFLTIFGGILLSIAVPAFALTVASDHPDPNWEIALGVTVAVSALFHGGGLAMWILTPGNIASQRPLQPETPRARASAVRWSLGAAPVRGGATLAGVLAF